jgi:hypothetical protein
MSKQGVGYNVRRLVTTLTVSFSHSLIAAVAAGSTDTWAAL